jgi:iron-sulfur cluster assembly protein
MAEMSSPPILTLTSGAALRIKELLSERKSPSLGVRVTLKTKGCSGLAYALEYVDQVNPTDEKVESQGVVLFVDAKAILFLIGTTMDYRDDPLSPGFDFINPNEKGRCGCGESFHA